MKKKWIKRVAILCGVCLVLVATMIIWCNVLVVNNAKGRTFDNVADVPDDAEWGILLATSPITPGGAHNFYFDNRIKAAVELYKAGKVKKILATGGDYTKEHRFGCDEPQAIRDSLVKAGVPDTCIVMDYNGRRTINSIYAARYTYELANVILISQKYHNERAIYQADHMGLEFTYGYNALPSHIRRNRIKNTIREYFARVLLFIDLTLD